MPSAFATHPPILFNTHGFLRDVRAVQCRFETLVSEHHHRPFTLTDDLGYTDAELTSLAERLFGGTAWPDTLHLAIVTGEPAIVEQCRGFLDAIVGETEDRGWQCWLMRIVVDGIMAMCANRTLDGLPMALRVRRRKALRKTLRSRRPYRSDDGSKCYEDHMAYARQNQWLCATTLLRWGTPGQTMVRAARQFMMCHESALMLIDDGECFTHGETVCIDGTDAGHGTAAPGTSSIDDYLQRLRSQADAAYRASTRRQQIAQELHTSRGMQPSDSDVRYVYDAERLIDAYQRLQYDDMPTHTELLTQVLLYDEPTGMDLWENPVYLFDMACSLLGCTEGFRAARFFETHCQNQHAVSLDLLEDHVRVVRDEGLAQLPLRIVGETQELYSQVDEVSPSYRTSLHHYHRRNRADAFSIILDRLPARNPARVRDIALCFADERYDDYARVVEPFAAAA